MRNKATRPKEDEVRLPDFLQFTPDERRAALALLLFTGGGGLLMEIGKRHPEWMPDLVVTRRGPEAGPPGQPDSTGGDSAALPQHVAVAALAPAAGEGQAMSPAEERVPPQSVLLPDSIREEESASFTPRRPASSKKKADPSAPVDVNTADPATLMTLPGIGPALAQRIVDDRAQNGPYRTVEDLARVKGIGKAAVERLRPVVRTE